MYIPIDSRLIVKKQEETVTASGIIVKPGDAYVQTLEVVETTPDTKRFKDKTILVERRHFEDFGDGFGSVKIENIMAIKE